MTRFDKLYAKTHPKAETTEKIKVDSAVEDFDEDVEEDNDDVEIKEGEEV